MLELIGQKMDNIKVFPFNNGIETGLRMLVLLTSAFPFKYDIDHLVYFDYMMVHSGDINPDIKSLHPAVPNRTGELFVRRSLIQNGIDLFIQKGFLLRAYTEKGIQYGATEAATPFLESLSEDYTQELVKRASWVAANYANIKLNDLRKMMNDNLSKIRNEFNLEFIQR
jgi:hypothetical protein